jgi:hypothetical protein
MKAERIKFSESKRGGSILAHRIGLAQCRLQIGDKGGWKPPPRGWKFGRPREFRVASFEFRIQARPSEGGGSWMKVENFATGVRSQNSGARMKTKRSKFQELGAMRNDLGGLDYSQRNADCKSGIREAGSLRHVDGSSVGQGNFEWRISSFE